MPVKVFDEVLISRVTSRPLTLEEIQGKGIVIDEQNFRAVEFEIGFVLDGVTIPVKFPVVAPAFKNNTEIIPAAELEERLQQAADINDELSQGVVLPPELETAKLDVQVKGINFQAVDEDGGPDVRLTIPPIPALMVIPGNIGFLNQFFSVMIFTENGAPAGSGLSVKNVNAELVLPAGPDHVPGTYAQPGDDPLRFARVGPNAVIQPVQPVRQPGADGKLGTADDIDRLNPGETGQGEFLVEGLQEGLHLMDLNLTADLEGLAAGVVKIAGRAAGSVLVRNPKFSFAFAHPRTTRAGEPYEAFVTILNTSQTPANLVNVTLNNNSISGGILESDETVELGTILPGQTATATFRIRSQRTGAITFSNITTSDDSLVGRFRLHAGVDERGVALSPDTLVLPNFVDELPADLLAAANRVLGQALSVAKAGQTPPGVLRVSTGYLKQKALELAEAGQRVRYGESLARVLPELLLDWQGARDFSAGWDQILRETNAGLEWRQAMMRAIEDANPGFATTRLLDAAQTFAGRGETWFFGAVSVGDFQTPPPSANELNLVKSTSERATLGTSSLAKALGYPGRAGAWLAAADAGRFEWKFAAEITSPFQTSVVLVRPDGTATELLWRLDNIAAGACLSYDATGTGIDLAIDDNCDGTVDRTLAAQRTDFTEMPPSVLAVRQDAEVLVGRPSKPCFGPNTTNEAGDPVPVRNYANVLAVLFSKPMTQSLANVPTAYTLDGGNEAAAVQIQPGGRIALLTMRQPVGALIPRSLSTAPTVKDARGNALASAPVAVHSRLVEGITVRGRVIRPDGSFSALVPVTLTYYDEVEAGLSGCLPWIARSAQVFTDANGEFQFDFVLAGIPYSVSATDTSGLSKDVVAALLESTHADALDRDRLLELATSPSVQNTLLADFAVGALPQAIAKAEGLDRALVRDFVESGGPREGTTAVYALRFRGRGTVSGQVLASDGISPVANAAVNLFPDPTSRELGRGVFSDSSGRFAFFGVPLGTFSVEATSASGLTRTISDVINAAGETKEIAIVLSASVPVLTELQGRVSEPDGTPHAGAQVFVGRFDPNTGKFGAVVASATTDSAGYWHANQVPANTYDLVALSADGKRKGERRNILAAAGAVNTVNLTLQARATVMGRVETSTGIPVANALVGGGAALVRTDALGRFTLTGVPTGQREIAAALERDPAAGIDFPRTGSGTVNVLPGAENFVIVRLAAAARIIGRVLDSAGNPVPNVDVAIPQVGGFFWVYTNAEGDFEFAGLALKKYDLSSPAPPHEDPFNGDAAAKSLINGSQDEILATIGEAFAAFTGVNNPLLNGEGATFNPGDWGFTKDVALGFDGQTVVADVRFLGRSTIGGVVKNGQGVPIGARVRLTGVGPTLTGAPTTVIRGERDSDPAVGTFSFDGQALIGDWGLQASSPFFPVVISTSGRTTTIAPDETNVVLQFPSTRETNGSLSGLVLLPDGITPAGAGVKVQISFGPDFVIPTGADGRFATQSGTFTLPAIDNEGRAGVGYTVTATDESTGATGRATVTVLPAQDNAVIVRLLGRGDAHVFVLRGDGTPAAGAAVEMQGGAYPLERFEGTTDASGEVVFSNVFEGPYGACASLGTGLTRIAGRASLGVQAGTSSTSTITLAGTGTVSGKFTALDGVTPIAFANVALGALAFTSTDAAGQFVFPDVPLGTFRLLATDAVTGRTGSVNVTLSFNGEARVVNLVETALGEVFGRVVNALGNGNVSNARVTLTHSDSFVAPRTVTTGPDGAFRFPGTPAGALTISAEDPLTHGRGSTSTTLPATAALFEVNVALAPVANLTVTVFEPDGTTPAALATVRIPVGNKIIAVDTDAQGQARFDSLELSPQSYAVTAESRAVGFTRRWAGAFKLLASQGAEETLSLTLRGTGSITGVVFQGDGVTPVAGAQVTVKIGSEPISVPGGTMPKSSSGQTENVITDGTGTFTFGNIPAGETQLAAISQALAASETVTISTNGETVTRDLVLSASGTVVGRIVRADGTTPAAGTDVLATFMSQSGLPGRINFRTAADGLFSLAPIPVGGFHLEITNAGAGGIARRDAIVTSNNETVNLGDIVLDEAFPTVVQITPADTATEVSTTTAIELLVSEALDPATVENSGIFIRRADTGAIVPATLTLTAPAGETALRRLLLVPASPLASEKTHQVIVVDGDLINAVGAVTNRGPRDLVGRPLAALFSASFTTRDGTPPTVLSFTPENNAEQVDVRSVVRLSFDEPIQAGASIILQGLAGNIAGTTSLGVNGLVLVFTPTVELLPNAVFTATVTGVKDIAGNFAVGQPLVHSFSSLDTIGPTIATLRIKNNQAPVAGSTINLETVLAAAEPGVRVRLTANFALIGVTSPGILELPFTLPASGTISIRAIAIDRFGNEGPFALLNIPVQANQPPQLVFERLNPVTGPVASGSPFNVRVSATDDGAVTELRAAATGAAVRPLQITAGSPINVATTVPAAAVPGTKVTILAQATDNSGASTGEQSFALAVSDGTPPNVAIENPAANSILDPVGGLALAVEWSDNSGAASLEATLTGTVTATQTQPGSGPPNVNHQTTFNFPLATAPLEGGLVTATVTATDPANLTRMATRTFRLPDLRPPELLGLVPANASAQQSLWTTGFTLVFDEPMDPATLGAPNLSVKGPGGAAVPFSTLLELNNTMLTVQLPVALTPGGSYTLTAGANLTDVAGNRWRDIGGIAVPPAGKVSTFTTAAITGVTPTPGSKIVPGQMLTSIVNYETGIGVQTWHFALNDDAATDVAAGATQTSTQLQLPVDATAAVFKLRGSRAGFVDYIHPEITLDLRPRSGDDDGDGWLNGFEADRGMNPFVADLDSDDFDHDGLTNGQERALATDPAKADTDGDTLTDGAEVAGGTNPLLADSDADGLRDDVDPFPNTPNLPPIANPDNILINAGEARTITIATELLANDTDPENQALTLESFTQPATGGVVTKPDSSTLIFTPNGGFSGGTTFTYTIRDPGNLTSTATVNVSVGNNNRPVAGDLLFPKSGGLLFDGTDDAANGPTLPGITDNFTMELWVRPNRVRGSSGEGTTGASSQGIGEFAVFPTHGTNQLGGDPNAGAGLSVGTNGFTVVEHAANYFPSPLVFDTPVSDWTHVAVVYQNKQPTLYVNGVPVRTGLTSPRIVHPGTELSTALGHYQGLMDEFRIWNYARTAQEIAASFGRRVSSGEPGLAVCWRMDEDEGLSLLDSSPAGRNGTLSGGTARVQPGAPLTQRGLDATAIDATPLLLVLPGSDPDNNPLTARILSLPAHGSLFQFTGSAAGAQIVAVPADVTDLERRVVYQADAGYSGEDGFAFTMFDGGLEAVPADALLHVVPPFGPMTDDVWDVSTGVTVTGSSGFIASSSGGNMFGASTGVEPGNALFADGHPAGFTHFVEWESPSFLRIEGARLFALDDFNASGGSGSAQRGFTEMRLFGRLNTGDPFTLLATYRPGTNPYFGPVRAVLQCAPFVGKQFRAEFDQFGNFASGGPRIQELDGIGETVVFVPVDQNIPLQNATATVTQIGFSPAATIDGSTTDSNGWAIAGAVAAQTIVWETAGTLTATPATEFVVKLIQNFGAEHFLGRFRVSATTDPRSEFADGLANGGDVTANWTVLDVTSVTGTGGETFAVQPDKSVLVSGLIPSATTYTVRLKGVSGDVTGFRLEALQDPSLPNNGPGRSNGNGNFVLGEVTAATPVNQANRAPQLVADNAQTPQGIPVTTGNVLANDTDPEGDNISLFDFTQPKAGTGSVANNGDGTFTYTPPDAAFTGTATFTYRATDTFQTSRPATVTISVVPSPERIWTNASGGNWSVASNWLNGQVPGPDDVAVIELDGTYTVTLDVNPTVSLLRLGGATGTQTLNLNGRTLSVLNGGTVAAHGEFAIRGDGRLTLQNSSELTVTGTFTFEQGTLTTGGRVIIAPSGVGNLTTTGSKFIDGVLENRGTLNYTGNGVLFGRDGGNLFARIENAAGGVFIVDGEGDFSPNFSSANYRIENAGTFIKRGAATTTIVNNPVFFSTTGLVQIESGELRLNGGSTLGGDFSGAGTLTFFGGTHSIPAGGNFALTSLSLNNMSLSIEAGAAPNLSIRGHQWLDAGRGRQPDPNQCHHSWRWTADGAEQFGIDGDRDLHLRAGDADGGRARNHRPERRGQPGDNRQ